MLYRISGFSLSLQTWHELGKWCHILMLSCLWSIIFRVITTPRILFCVLKEFRIRFPPQNWNECHALFTMTESKPLMTRMRGADWPRPQRASSTPIDNAALLFLRSPLHNFAAGTSPPLVKKITKTASATPCENERVNASVSECVPLSGHLRRDCSRLISVSSALFGAAGGYPEFRRESQVVVSLRK